MWGAVGLFPIPPRAPTLRVHLAAPPGRRARGQSNPTGRACRLPQAERLAQLQQIVEHLIVRDYPEAAGAGSGSLQSRVLRMLSAASARFAALQVRALLACWAGGARAWHGAS